jgi:hypothetical protein
MFVLHQLFNLSDQGLPFEVNNSRFFEDFVAVGV